MSEELPKMPADPKLEAWWKQLGFIVDNVIAVDKEHGMGCEYLSALLSALGVDEDAEKLREASWHALCEWDL